MSRKNTTVSHTIGSNFWEWGIHSLHDFVTKMFGDTVQVREYPYSDKYNFYTKIQHVLYLSDKVKVLHTFFLVCHSYIDVIFIFSHQYVMQTVRQQ
jgi:hypothetical protein